MGFPRSTRGFRALDRGEFSIIAAFSLVVILAGAGLFLQTFTPVPVSQTATVTATASTDIKQDCQPGNVNKIQVANAKGDFNTPPKDNTIDCYANATDQQKKSDVPTSSDQQCKGLAHNQCKVIACAPYTVVSTQPIVVTSNPTRCATVGICNTDDPESCNKLMNKLGSGSATDVIGAMQSYGGDLKGFSQIMALTPVNGGSTLGSVFSEQLTQVQTQTQAHLTDVESQIATYTAACTGTSAGTCDSTDVQKLQDLQAQQAQLQQQMKDLSSAQQTLSTQYQGPCPNGGIVNPATGTCNTTAAPPCTTVGCSVPLPPPTPNNTGTFGSGSLSSLLSGLSRGLIQQPLAPAAAPAAPAQACSTDANAYSQQQQQYQQQLQQYNYQLQQAQYQQQLNSYYGGGYSQVALPAQPVACTPSTQSQCSLQPQQPAASSCTGGSWSPQMQGSCIVGWQCSNLGAQLSCQPQTADVGMSLAIAYSCAQGTASSSGFDASGQSGTTTVLVAAPPSGSNTATYRLTCTNGAVTSGAQCSVQIATPTIILVANPATVSPGATSLVGWVTTGMQACVISSPEDATFTSQNSANTSPNGTAQTLPATGTQQYLLRCTTVSAGTKEATVTVAVK